MPLTNRSKRPLRPQWIQKLLADLKPYQPDQVILFGSRARGQEDDFSDIDLVILKETRVNFLDRGVEARHLIRPELLPIDLFVYTRKEWKALKDWGSPFYEKVTKTGRVVYEKPRS